MINLQEGCEQWKREKVFLLVFSSVKSVLIPVTSRIYKAYITSHLVTNSDMIRQTWGHTWPDQTSQTNQQHIGTDNGFLFPVITHVPKCRVDILIVTDIKSFKICPPIWYLLDIIFYGSFRTCWE